jgi:hypothetical protein
VLNKDGNPDKPDRVDGIINLLSSRLNDVFASGPDEKLQAVLEARRQSLGGDQADKPEDSSVRNEVTKANGTTSQTNHVHQSGGESLSSGKKRARSSSSDRTTSEHPSNKPRKETVIEEKSPTDPSQGVQAESSTDCQQDVAGAGGNLLTSAKKQLIHAAGGDGIAEHQESGQAQSSDSLPEGRTPPQNGSPRKHTARVALADFPLLKPRSYHPSQPYEIISVVEGSPMATMQDIQFELNDEKATLVKRWVDRYDTFECVQKPCARRSLMGDLLAKAVLV